MQRFGIGWSGSEKVVNKRFDPSHSRGNQRQTIFRAVADRRRYLELLNHYRARRWCNRNGY